MWSNCTDKQLSLIGFYASRIGGEVYADARLLENDMLAKIEASDIIQKYLDNKLEDFARLIKATLTKPKDLSPQALPGVVSPGLRSAPPAQV